MPNLRDNIPISPSRWTRGDVGREIGAWIMAEVKEALALAGINGRKIDAGGLVGTLPAGMAAAPLSIVFQFGDGQNPIVAASEREQWLECNFSGTITGYSLTSDVSGAIVIDIWKDTYAAYPPVVGDSIVAAAKPTLSGAVKAEDNVLTGWDVDIVAGDTLKVHVDSASTLAAATLTLRVMRTNT